MWAMPQTNWSHIMSNQPSSASSWHHSKLNPPIFHVSMILVNSVVKILVLISMLIFLGQASLPICLISDFNHLIHQIKSNQLLGIDRKDEANFHVCNSHIQFCRSFHKCMFLINEAKKWSTKHNFPHLLCSFFSPSYPLDYTLVTVDCFLTSRLGGWPKFKFKE